MTSYERVKLALEHKEADKVPFDLGSTVLTGMNIGLYENLREYLGMKKIDRNIVDITQQLAYIDEDMIERLGVDVRCVDPQPPHHAPNMVPPHKDGAYYRFVDEWGIQWKMPVDGGHYYDMVAHPFEDVETFEELEGLANWPNSQDPGRFETMKQRADHFRYEKEQAYVLGRHTAGIWEMALWTSGFEKFYCDMVTEKEYAHRLLGKFTELKMQYWEKALEEVGENVLVVAEADDLATQISTLISPQMYKEMVSPYHKKLFDFIRQKAKAPVHIFYHTCGAAKELIPYLIDEGVDILNPVQVSASNMDSKDLKREFGKDVTFWGGGVDTQIVLPTGTVQQVKDEVKRRIEDLAPGGGFVFNTVHNAQSDVPAENYYAMWETLQEYGIYK